MLIRSQRHLPHSPHHLSHTRLPSQVRPQHQLVHEKSDQPLRFHLLPPCHVRPHHHVQLPRPPRQHHLERRQQTHKHRHPGSPTHFPQLPAHLSFHSHPHLPSSVTRLPPPHS